MLMLNGKYIVNCTRGFNPQKETIDLEITINTSLLKLLRTISDFNEGELKGATEYQLHTGTNTATTRKRYLIKIPFRRLFGAIPYIMDTELINKGRTIFSVQEVFIAESIIEEIGRLKGIIEAVLKTITTQKVKVTITAKSRNRKTEGEQNE